MGSAGSPGSCSRAHTRTVSARGAPYLSRLHLKEGTAPRPDAYPFTIPVIGGLDIEFVSPVTFFVGENGTGKSTVIEAIAALCRLPVSGGGRNELADRHGPDTSSALAAALRPAGGEPVAATETRWNRGFGGYDGDWLVPTSAAPLEPSTACDI